MTESIAELEKDENVFGMILTSSNPKIFSAGLDIKEMYKPDKKRLAAFWKSLQQLFLKLYVSPLITIAAVEGQSPAGGCLMAMSCDYRIMSNAQHVKMGLNETQLGIVAPFWFKDVLVNTIGHRQAEKMLMLGEQYSGKEAIKYGLVDEIVSQEKVLETAEAEMLKWLKIPGWFTTCYLIYGRCIDRARSITKYEIRESTYLNLKNRVEEDLSIFEKLILSENAQNTMGKYLAMLQSKRK